MGSDNSQANRYRKNNEMNTLEFVINYYTGSQKAFRLQRSVLKMTGKGPWVVSCNVFFLSYAWSLAALSLKEGYNLRLFWNVFENSLNLDLTYAIAFTKGLAFQWVSIPISCSAAEWQQVPQNCYRLGTSKLSRKKYAILLYRHECFSGKYTTHKINWKLHSGP